MSDISEELCRDVDEDGVVRQSQLPDGEGVGTVTGVEPLFVRLAGAENPVRVTFGSEEMASVQVGDKVWLKRRGARWFGVSKVVRL